jgi:hypothetical protein
MTTDQFEIDRDRLHRILNLLKEARLLPDGQWFLNGSAVLVLHDIRTGRPMGDLDIFLATRQWFRLHYLSSHNLPVYDGGPHYRFDLRTPDPDAPQARHDPAYLERVIGGLPVHVFSAWRVRHVADIDCNFLTLNAETVEGWPCAPLQMVLDWKCQKLRAKDTIDVEAIYRARPELRPASETS